MGNRINLSALVFLGAILLAIGIALSVIASIHSASASTPRFAEYQSTTTQPAIFGADVVVLTGNNTLGSIIVTGTSTGTINIYDATTTNVLLRTGQIASSSILKASIIPAITQGTFTYDLLLTNGLLVDTVGTMPTTTITYRPN